MTNEREAIFDSLLSEAEGKAPDVTSRVLQAMGEQLPQAPAQPPQVLEQRTSPWLWVGSVLAVAAALAVAFLLLYEPVSAPAGDKVLAPVAPPRGVVLSDSAKWHHGERGYELESGVVLIRSGAPALNVSGAKVENVEGLVAACTGGEPNDGRWQQFMTQMTNQGFLTKEELKMLSKAKRWLVAGSAAICVLAGSAMIDGSVVHAEDKFDKHAEELIKKLDKNKDGAISKDEGNSELMSGDADKDGKLTKTEMAEHFRAAAKFKAEKRAKERAELITKRTEKKVDALMGADANKDSEVSEAELKAACPKDVETMMKRLDTNKDAKITRDEAKAIYAEDAEKEVDKELKDDDDEEEEDDEHEEGEDD